MQETPHSESLCARDFGDPRSVTCTPPAIRDDYTATWVG